VRGNDDVMFVEFSYWVQAGLVETGSSELSNRAELFVHP